MAALLLAPPPNEVLRFNGKTGAPMGAFVKAGSGLTEPHNLTFGPDGSLYVGGPTGVLQFSGETGAFIRLFAPARLPGLGNVGGLAFGPDGDLYVSDWQKSDVLRYDGKTGCLQKRVRASERAGGQWADGICEPLHPVRPAWLRRRRPGSRRLTPSRRRRHPMWSMRRGRRGLLLSYPFWQQGTVAPGHRGSGQDRQDAEAVQLSG